MSGLAVAFQRDERPVDRALVERMIEVSLHRATRGRETTYDGPIGLAGLSSQVASMDHVSAVFDGRLDAREELAELLETGREVRDVDLIVAAYLRFGEEFVERLVGDFALAIWNARERVVLLARDLFGARPLHYYVDRDRLVAASDLAQVLETEALRRRPNEEVVALILAGADGRSDETLYADVHRVPPASLVRVDARSVRTRRFWSPRDVPRVRHANDAAYAEHFRDVFERGVRATLRAPTKPAVDLSGGLDSSSIAATARSLGLDILTYSHIYPGAPHDESEYSRAVVARWPGEHHELATPPRPMEEWVDQARWSRDLPSPPNSTTYAQLDARVVRGTPVRIIGIGGDELLDSADPTSLAVERLRHGELKMLRSAPLFRTVITAVVPHSALAHVRSLLRPPTIPAWIDDGLARRTNLQARLTEAREPVVGYASIERCRPYDDGGRLRAIEQEERIAARRGCEVRAPFAFKPLVELVLGMPPDQLVRDRDTKFVLRNAMRGVLPEVVRTRRDKSVFGALRLAEVHALGNAPLAIDALGWVRADFAGSAELLPTRWIVYAVDRWFRASF